MQFLFMQRHDDKQGSYRAWKVLEKGYRSWKVLENNLLLLLNSTKNMKCTEGSKES